jgi:hypothetical protein
MNLAPSYPTSRFWLAFAAYLVPTFPLGYFWHLAIFQQQYHALQMYRADVIIPMGLASMLIQGVLFAWMYPRLFSTARGQWLASAARFFALFALFAWTWAVLPVAAKYQMTSVARFMLLETAFTLVQFLVVAPLIALAYREGHASRSLAHSTPEGTRAVR